MNAKYKFDIYEKFLETIGFMYLVMGFVTIYSWACKALDWKSPNDDVLSFWEPMAGVNGLLNVVNVFLIGFFIWSERKRPYNRNENRNVLFYFMSGPAFIVTMVYLIFEIVIHCMSVKSLGAFSLFMVIGEFCLICAAMVLVVHNDLKSQSEANNVEKLHKNFVIFITAIGLINYFLFHLCSMQITSFMDIASSFPDYNGFYNATTRNTSSHSFDVAKDYLQPIVILHCFISLVYLVLQKYSHGTAPYYSEMTNHTSLSIEPQKIGTTSELSPFRLPPLSLVLGILFITFSLLVLIVVDRFFGTEKYYWYGQFIFTIYPIPVYLGSVFLLGLQIYEMQRWPKLCQRKNLIDKILIWIGVTGQLLSSFAQIKYWYYWNQPCFTWVTITEYVCLILQVIVQTVTIGLALDRKWISPVLDSWYARICPTVGMLSINVAFLLFSLYIVYLSENNAIFNKIQNQPLFIHLFGAELISFGTALSVLHRLHSSLIFGRLILYLYY